MGAMSEHAQSTLSLCEGREWKGREVGVERTSEKSERTLGLVDIRCGGEAFRSYGEKGEQQSLRWNQIQTRED